MIMKVYCLSNQETAQCVEDLLHPLGPDLQSITITLPDISEAYYVITVIGESLEDTGKKLQACYGWRTNILIESTTAG